MVNKSSIIRVYVHWLMQLILFAFCLPFVIGVIGLVKNIISSLSASTFISLFLVLVLTWYFAALALSTVEISDDKIRVKVPHGTFSMRWDEVELIVTDGGLFSFLGGDKQLSVSMVLAGIGKKEFYVVLDKQIETRGIVVEQSSQVPLLHRKTRE